VSEIRKLISRWHRDELGAERKAARHLEASRAVLGLAAAARGVRCRGGGALSGRRSGITFRPLPRTRKASEAELSRVCGIGRGERGGLLPLCYHERVNSEFLPIDARSITDKQLLHRQVTYFVLLNAEHTYLQSSLAHVRAQANRYTDMAALFQALSGGWWNRVYIPSR
jgi:hypothetical protein